ncbi:MAG: Potassium-transporting ATPase C chain [Syntrophus sp. PtaB.Bin138]|nr:MAG: Potassium-transporting ATPase C chain [Syntrophus sp. PtaB.Bin138]
MLKEILVQIRVALLAVASLAVLLCGAYPLAVWVIAQGLFPWQANGSLLIRERGVVAGSILLAQRFEGPAYFHPRSSAAGKGYDAADSRGSNLGPTSKKLIDTVKKRMADYRRDNDLGPEIPIPADAVTASGSGLDPHISVSNAHLQAKRVAKVRGLDEARLRNKIAAFTTGRDLSILGEPRVNVLMLNLDLDGKVVTNHEP